jgi:pilus assembly protein CpaD
MSSNRGLVLTAALLAAASLAGCATTHSDPEPFASRTPTEQFEPKVDNHVEGIQLAVHSGDLSQAQASALWGLVSSWRDAGSGQIQVETPQGPMAADMAAKIQDALQGFGIRRDQYHLSFYPSDTYPQAGPAGVVRVSYKHYVASMARCGDAFSDFTKTANNAPESNFGCAVTANIAAMVANPTDLASQRPMDPIDAGRRQVVLDKYRAGEATSSAKDDQADGTVSSVAKQ